MFGAVNNDDRGWSSFWNPDINAIFKPDTNASTEASYISDNPTDPNSLAARLSSGNVG